MSCPQYLPYISGATTAQGLETLVQTALGDIRASVNHTVDFGVPTASLTEIRNNLASSAEDSSFLAIRNPCGASRFIERTNRAYVLNHEEWMANQRWTGGQTFLGRYLYAPAVILLHSFKSTGLVSWCKNALIHEVLHSVSLYSRLWNSAQDLIAKHEPLNEVLRSFCAAMSSLKDIMIVT